MISDVVSFIFSIAHYCMHACIHTMRLQIQLLTLEQARHLLDATRVHQLEVLLTVAVTTGMRHGELTALWWSDITFENGSLHVHRTVNRLGSYGGYHESEPKTAKSNRTIVLPTFVLEKLQKHRIRQLKARLKLGSKWREHNLVFPNEKGLHSCH